MKRTFKWIGIVVGGLLGMLILLLISASVVSASRLGRTYEVTADFELHVPDDPQRISEGERVYAIMCSGCHGENLAGMEVSDDLMFGRIRTANLTSGDGGLGEVYSDADFARAIWYGVKRDGSPTAGMPVELNQGIHVEDMENLLAYIRSVPPINTNPPEMRPGIMLRVMHAANLFPLATAEHVDLNAAPRRPVASEDTLAFGEYLAVLCTACHGTDYAGDDMAGGVNITPHETALGTWTEADFSGAIREGIRPDGTEISTDMPWESFSNYSDEEVHAIWTYLQTIAPVAKE